MMIMVGNDGDRIGLLIAIIFQPETPEPEKPKPETRARKLNRKTTTGKPEVEKRIRDT